MITSPSRFPASAYCTAFAKLRGRISLALSVHGWRASIVPILILIGGLLCLMSEPSWLSRMASYGRQEQQLPAPGLHSFPTALQT